MASATVDTPMGTTVSEGTTGFEAEVTALSFDGPTRGEIETTHFGTTGAKSFDAADLEDSGSVTITAHFNPDTTPWTRNAKATWTIDWPSGTDWSFSGFATSYPPDASDMEGPMTVDVEVRIDGQIEVSQSS